MRSVRVTKTLGLGARLVEIVLARIDEAESLPDEEQGTTGRAPRCSRGPLLAAGYLHGFRTSINGGGAFSTDTGFAAGRLGFPVGAGLILGGQLALQGDWYSFRDNNPGAATPDPRPWGDIHSARAPSAWGRSSVIG
ncbi:MAG: hypothetical protein P8R42_10400 [Candidatus Binatia bacterium]|nr:hypothetical protein [Candidatus Binatia bacterium]